MWFVLPIGSIADRPLRAGGLSGGATAPKISFGGLYERLSLTHRGQNHRIQNAPCRGGGRLRLGDWFNCPCRCACGVWIQLWRASGGGCPGLFSTAGLLSARAGLYACSRYGLRASLPSTRVYTCTAASLRPAGIHGSGILSTAGPRLPASISACVSSHLPAHLPANVPPCISSCLWAL